jgi:hypothetical protein
MTPAIVWSHGPGGDAAALQALRDLLQSVPIAQLPRRVHEERRAAMRDETRAHRGMSLALVWDDADYAPPEQDESARARVETI